MTQAGQPGNGETPLYLALTSVKKDYYVNQIKVWARCVYTSFAPLPADGNYVDDYICYLRALALGSGVKVKTVTFYEGVGDNQSTGGVKQGGEYARIIQQERFNDKYDNVSCQPLKDTLEELRHYAKSMSEPEKSQYEVVLSAVEKRIAGLEFRRSFWRKGTINRIRITHATGKWSWFRAIRCLPMPVFAFLLSLARKFKRKK